MTARQTYRAGIYARLSRDDERQGESISIENQKLILTRFCESQGWQIMGCYVDDGWTGTNFDRPAFRRLIEDVRDKRVNLVIVKDDCVIKARTPQTLENRHFLRIGAKFGAILRPQRTAHIIGNS